MHRIDVPSATPGNLFTEGSPSGGVPATTVDDEWLNAVQEEMMSILAAAGVTGVKGDWGQVLQALPAALATLPELARSHGANGYAMLLGDSIIQWGGTGVISAGSSVTVTYPITFPNNVFSASATPGVTANTTTPTGGGVQFTTPSQMIIRNLGATLGYSFQWIAIGN